MISRKLNFYINFFQLTLILPFQYNKLTHKFQKSKKLECISVIVCSIIFLVTFYSVYLWIIYASCFNVMGSVDMYLIKLSWFMLLGYILVVAYEKLFKQQQLIDLLNDIFDIHQKFNYYDLSFKTRESIINKFLDLLTFDIFLLITIKLTVDAVYFISVAVYDELIVACILLMAIASWIFLSIKPLFITIQCFTLLLKNINCEISGLYNKMDSLEDADKLAQLCAMYIKFVDVLDKIFRFYQLHIIFYLFEIVNSFLWQCYVFLDLMVLHLSQFYTYGFIPPMFYGVNSIYSQYQLNMFIHWIDMLLKEQHKTIYLLHDLQLITVDDKLKNIVIIFRFSNFYN